MKNHIVIGRNIDSAHFTPSTYNILRASDAIKHHRHTRQNTQEGLTFFSVSYGLAKIFVDKIRRQNFRYISAGNRSKGKRLRFSFFALEVVLIIIPV